MAQARGSKWLRRLIYASAGGSIGTAALYTSYRPRDIPGTEAAQVPPPSAQGGEPFKPRAFPLMKSREQQIAKLRRTAVKPTSINSSAEQSADNIKNQPSESLSQDEDTAASEIYDLLIIGGGATGCGIALDAASRGLNVALVERDDFSSGTSSKSTKLVHGGVRYLEKAVWQLDYSQYRLVKEALKERRYFLDTAPHLSQWLPIMLPLDKWYKIPYFWAGTKFYDFLAGSENIESSYFLTRSKAIEAFPMLSKDNLIGALVYYDGAHNDSRMNVSLAMTAALYGATVVNHMEVTSLTKNSQGRLNGAVVIDKIAEMDGTSPQPITIQAKGIINATGPFSDSIRKMDDPNTEEIVAPSLGVHVVLPGYFSPSNMGLIDPSTSDGRVIFFLPWQGNTIAGTTDTPTPISAEPIASEEDIQWILKEIRDYLAPDINLRRGDVLAAWSGIRPLVRDPKAQKTEGLVRNHLITTSADGLMTCAGGKWTTYREMAEETVDRAIGEFSLKTRALDRIPNISGTDIVVEDEPVYDGSCQTHRTRLIGAHGYSKTLFINLIQHFGIETEVAKHLCTSYGDRAWRVAALCAPTEERFPIRGKRISPLYPYVDGEVRYAVRHEYAQTAVDVLARRIRLSFLNAQAALEALPLVIDLMSEELHWSKKRRQEEWDHSLRFLASMGLPESKLNLSREQVESGHVGLYPDEEYHLYARHDKPSDVLDSDNRLLTSSPIIQTASLANK